MAGLKVAVILVSLVCVCSARQKGSLRRPAPARPHRHQEPQKAADNFHGPSNVTLFLYTKKNPNSPEYLLIGNDSASPNFNPDNPTKLFIHGWIGSADTFADFPSAYFDNGFDYNIVLVDWSKGAADLNTSIASNNSILTGDYVGEVLNYFVANRGLDLNKLYIVGHSMGGQLAGIVGNRVGGAAAEVVGLDPAADLYDAQPLRNQIDPSDAQFVQIIHTNGGGYGVPDPRGTVDFFVNDGRFQPGCGNYSIGYDTCSHVRVLNVYLESIGSRGFVASQCASLAQYLAGDCARNAHAVMGEGTPSNVSGVYYLLTHSDSPYAEGDIGL